MNKNEKIFFIIFIGLSVILILTVNLVIKRYEMEATPSSLPKQEDIKPTEPHEEEEKEYIEGVEEIEIEEEGPISGPLLY